MNTKVFGFALAALLAAGSAPSAQAPPRRARTAVKRTVRRHPVAARRAKNMLDRNQDGKVGPLERKRALERMKRRRAEMNRRRAEMMRRRSVMRNRRAGPMASPRFRAFLKAHPALMKEARAKADLNHDGRISPLEKQRIYAWLLRRYQTGRVKGAREKAGEFLQNHPEAARRLKNRADLNQDGRVGPLERRRAVRRTARRVVRRRLDLNHDGRVGPLERARAAGRAVRRAVRPRLPRPPVNPVRAAGKAARAVGKAARRVMDRNHDGRVGPVERRRAARRVHRRVVHRRRR